MESESTRKPQKDDDELNAGQQEEEALEPLEESLQRHGDDMEELEDEDEDELLDDDEEVDDDVDVFRGRRPEPHRAIPLPDRLFVKVYDKNGDGTANGAVGTLYLSERIFGHDDIRRDLLQRAVEHHRACVRGRRTAITKTVSTVSGSGKKVRPQKGGGQARAGHRRPAHWRGGAKAHGPKGTVQDYGARKLNKRVRKLALTHALSQKLKENNLILINDWNLDSHKTKDFARVLSRWGVGGRYGTTALLLDHVEQKKEEEGATETVNGLPIRLLVASGNLYSIQVLNQLRANVYSILRHEKLFMTVSAVQALEDRLVPAMK